MNGMILLQAIDADTTYSFGSGNIYQDVLMVSFIVVMITVLITAIVLLKAFKTIIRVSMPEIEVKSRAATAAKRTARKLAHKQRWAKWMGLRPLAEEEDLIIEHAYDGIQELDNPTPAWFMGLFYATMIFALGYLSVYYVFGVGLNQDQEYEREMTIAEQQRQVYLASQANNVDENSVQVDKSPEVLTDGKSIFQQNCIACHGNAGEGGIGPNLTDDYWLHGAGIKQVFRTITHGVPDKGMIAWEQQLSPAQIAHVANYVLSLRGTNPPNPKAPQGELVTAAPETAQEAAETIQD